MRTNFRTGVCALALMAGGCTSNPQAALQRLVEARQLSADLLVQYTKAADASNLAVMADTDDASAAFVHEAEAATQAVQAGDAALRLILTGLGYSNESRLLEEFEAAFTAYRTLDQTILGLAVENTNLKAQRLSFGAGQEAADAFAQSLEDARPAGASDSWRVQALAASAVARVREIQALQAPHIAEADEAKMAELETRMDKSEAAVRGALQTLGPLASGSSRSRVAAAAGDFDRFMAANLEIVRLSRRNSNVRSLALALGQKRTLAARCEETLQGLQTSLAKRQLGGTR